MTKRKFTDEELDKAQFEDIRDYIKVTIKAIRCLRGNYLFIEEAQGLLESVEKLFK